MSLLRPRPKKLVTFPPKDSSLDELERRLRNRLVLVLLESSRVAGVESRRLLDEKMFFLRVELLVGDEVDDEADLDLRRGI